ncbi:hypothetical protein BKA93DRAFT_208485 [Sparassis latifolia]
MDSFGGIQSFWDISQQPDSFSSLPDDDFLAFLEKQFPTTISNPVQHFDPTAPIPVSVPEVIDPQNLTRFPSNSTPTSSDSSPSPPSLPNDSSPSRRQSGVYTHSTSPTGELDDAGLKRKASNDSMVDEPTHKSQHTNNLSTSSNTSKKGISSSRRKSTGNPNQDETRLLKRKEQNRAAQRAFRERKEKHVKDLEDKVAALEAKNQVTESENENLRDLLSRLQNENMALKQAAFTFQVPRDTSASNSQSFSNGPTSFNFSTPGAGPSKVASPPLHPPQPPFNFGSLISFDPNMLNMNDEPTTTDGAMNVDYAFGQPVPYKTIAANPMYMSFAEPSPYDSPQRMIGNGNGNGNGGSNHFSSMSSFDHWTPPDPNGLDQLFGGNYIGTNQNGVDFNALLASPPSSLSPVSHAARSTSSSSPSSSDGSIKSTSLSTPGNPTSPTADHDGNCPRTKEDLQKFISDQGDSQFACEMPVAPFLRKANSEEGNGQMIMCKGSSFPTTEESENNVEVLAAWRSITSNPQFKDLDINQLCSEFTKKARCDGTKVVLEPQGVHCIIEALAAKRQQQQMQQ